MRSRLGRSPLARPVLGFGVALATGVRSLGQAFALVVTAVALLLLVDVLARGGPPG